MTQDELIRVFALYRRNRAPDACLTLVGDPIGVREGGKLVKCEEELLADGIQLRRRKVLPLDTLVEVLQE